MHPIRIAAVAGALISAATSTTSLSDHPPLETWQIVAGWLLVLAFCVAMVFGQGRPQVSIEAGSMPLARSWRLDSLITICASVPLLIVVLGSGSVTWLAFVVVVIAAASQQVPAGIAASVPSAVALGYASWHAHQSSATLLINAVALVAVFGFVWFRRAQREAQELADAQQETIRHERARTEAAEHQQRVAAQLHDVLAHTLSGLIVSLQTASVQARQEQTSPELQQRLSAATVLAKEGLHGARDAVASLHQPSTGADSRVALADWWRATTDRLRTTADLQVSTTGDVGDVPPQWRSLAQSVLREALTNSLRHAAGRPVRVTFSPHEIRVLSEGDVTVFEPGSHTSGGFGLSGLRQRVESAGGAFSAGARSDGWLVTMTWPQSGGVP